ncbi:MAG: hypothetical protein OXD46_15125 [Chloroflexi bacterium]|nr:hypothetical protein [Chloroflexota bacterium]
MGIVYMRNGVVGSVGMESMLDYEYVYVILMHTHTFPTRSEVMRIGVNIPNDLYRRMEPIKHTINVSQLCREALEAHVEDYERARARLESDDISETTNRLFREEEHMTVDWKELGWTDAKEWVEAVDKVNFEHLFHRVDILKKQGRPTWIVPPPGAPEAKRFDQRAWEHSEYFEHLFDLNQEGDPREDAEEEYGRAWLAYVCAVRRKIQQLSEERLMSKLESPTVQAEPEVPEQLMP